MKYRIYLVNFGWHLHAEFDTLEAACLAGGAAGYEFVVELGETQVAHWTMFGGLRLLSGAR